MQHPHLERARDALQDARESAGTEDTIREQLDSLQEGIFEEDVGDEMAADPIPKVDRIAEVRDKLGGLEEEADDAETIEYISDAREHLLEFMEVRSETDT